MGDIHLGGSDTERLRTVLEAAKNHGDAFVIFLGDLVDKGDRESLIAFRSQISEFGFENKSLYVLGNHDVFDNGWVHWRELMGPSHFDIVIGNCHFFVLDSADGIVGEKQSQWLEAKLKNSTSAHKIVLSHYMPLVPGQRTYLRLADELEAVSLMKLLTRYEATAWLGGHYHSFVQEKIENVTYLVAGGGGGRRMEPIKDNFFVRAQVTADKISFELIKF